MLFLISAFCESSITPKGFTCLRSTRSLVSLPTELCIHKSVWATFLITITNHTHLSGDILTQSKHKVEWFHKTLSLSGEAIAFIRACIPTTTPFFQNRSLVSKITLNELRCTFLLTFEYLKKIDKTQWTFYDDNTLLINEHLFCLPVILNFSDPRPLCRRDGVDQRARYAVAWQHWIPWLFPEHRRVRCARGSLCLWRRLRPQPTGTAAADPHSSRASTANAGARIQRAGGCWYGASPLGIRPPRPPSDPASRSERGKDMLVASWYELGIKCEFLFL